MELVVFTSEEFMSNKKLFNDILLFSSKAFAEDDTPAQVNMDVSNWQEKAHTLLYILAIEKRFSKDLGRIFCLYDKGKIVAISGVYRSDFAPDDILIAGVRAYTLKKYRAKNLVGEYIIPAVLEYAKENSFKQCWFTANEYNERVIKMLKRKTGVGYSWHENCDELFVDMEFPDGPFNIKNTPQYIAVKKIDLDYKFDYDTLKCD